MINEDILNGARTAFIDEHISSSPDFKPKLLFNSPNTKVRNELIDNLRNCDEFIISTAFITLGGIVPLLEEFKNLESRNIKGKILTTDYLNFTEPKALEKLQSFKNIEVKMFTTESEGFHTKGYIFKKGDNYSAIVGSSNLTEAALVKNKEWNVGFTTTKDGEIINNLLNEFNQLWDKSKELSDILPAYEKLYNDNLNFKQLRKTTEELKKKNITDLVPNSMQEQFLTNIRNLIKSDEKRAILVSATGTGKTYASAFAVKDFNPKRFLFIVHREQIAKQSINAYKNVIKDKTFGLLTGNKKDFNADYIFATIQTLSKDDIYTKFEKDEFDYIIIDEVHKAGALSYQKIFEYFKPKFYLGMTASPERTDGFDIYELFDHNIAHEIRLQEALEEDLLCPFHYFGIHDVKFDDEEINDDFRDFNYLASNKRVDYLLEKSEFYGYSGDRIKALVFCSRKDEAKLLSQEFNKRGHPSVVLTGDDSQAKRLDAIDRLTNDDNPNKLEYIFTVDIFNEGVDIPEINQVLLVRPTESPIIFIQQLGRGLRKFKNKDFVVILDFIGNYKNNYMIPLALSGDRSYDKDKLRRYLMEGNKIIPGVSSINFDEVSKQKIYESINNTSFSRVALFKEKYNNLKFKLGKIPLLCDFYNNADFNPELILAHNQFPCYHLFLNKVEDDYLDTLSDDEINSLVFISQNLANGKRPHEILILKCLMANNCFDVDKISNLLFKMYGIEDDLKSIESAINILKLDFFVDKEKAKYGITTFFDENNRISNQFKNFISHDSYRKHLDDVLDYALLKYENVYLGQNEGVNLKLFEKYSRKDACRLLNWPHDDSSTMYGYRIKHGTCPIFVTYDKNEDISESTKYKDEFISKEAFSWMTRSKVKLESKEAQAIIKDKDLKIHMFVKKSDDEGRDFYYIGQATPVEWHQTTIKNDKGQILPIVNFKYSLHNIVGDELYDYFTKDFED
ncbi:DEAD/DEAH box helicase [Methanobrevibacter millerae]|uniref:DEAD/DEAH box helicase domain-containing protein n=1 Tax=Methanobrevibacter millerae TaxID=230361 RepID=A0A0U2L3C4_9EURY|nr:DEAD/DEAH box helicase [Methanobrevibacter millerae]ALT68062.1 DEAD/DEAH box helicase domain-containing protein [Methanobrevibacter millerae]